VATCLAVMWVVGDVEKIVRPQSESLPADKPAPTRAAKTGPSGPLEAGLQKLATQPIDGLSSTGATVADSRNRIETQAAGTAAARPGEVEPTRMKKSVQLANAAVNSGVPVSPAPPARAGAMVPLALALPMPTFMGTPTDVPANEHLEKPSDKPRPALLVPSGVVNVALRKPVASSDRSPVTGSLDLITDGDKESNDGS
jgi:hypothetical protein